MISQSWVAGQKATTMLTDLTLNVWIKPHHSVHLCLVFLFPLLDIYFVPTLLSEVDGVMGFDPHV